MLLNWIDTYVGTGTPSLQNHMLASASSQKIQECPPTVFILHLLHAVPYAASFMAGCVVNYQSVWLHTLGWYSRDLESSATTTEKLIRVYSTHCHVLQRQNQASAHWDSSYGICVVIDVLNTARTLKHPQVQSYIAYHHVDRSCENIKLPWWNQQSTSCFHSWMWQWSGLQYMV